MKNNDLKKQPTSPLSLFVAENLVLLYFSILAVLTIFTHFSQFFGLSFRTYAYGSFIFLVLVFIVYIRYQFFSLIKTTEKDYLWTLRVFGLCFFCGLLSISYHRIGRISPDEFYYAANPSYFLAHPDSRMGYQIHTFYSKESISSIAYLTAGPYEYIQSVAAFLGGVQSFALLYYFVAPVMAGAIICASYFLLIHWFVSDSKQALIGTFGIVCAIFLMGETSTSPGSYSFMRAFEGKSFFLFAGLPLFAYFSLKFFDSTTWDRILKLLLLTTALAGITTSAIPMLPLFGLILFLSYLFANWKAYISVYAIVCRGLFYLFGSSYLILYGIYIALFDDRNAAYYFNRAYIVPFWEYLKMFYYKPFPTTAVFFIFFSTLVFFWTKKKAVFLFLWITLTIGLVLNPLVGNIYLNFFPGIYFRFFYILPFPLVIGLTIAFGSVKFESYLRNASRLFWFFVILLSLILLLALPTSIFHQRNYALGNVLKDREFVNANNVVRFAPKGVIIAPYLISGAIQMLDGSYLPLLQRKDIVEYYLTVQTKSDAELRLQAGGFISGENDNYVALFEIARNYPELKTIVLNRKVYYRFELKINRPLLDMYFHVKKLGDVVIYWR